MRAEGGTLILSATDLSNFLNCRHRTALELGEVRGKRRRPAWTDPLLEALFARGLEHERNYLSRLDAAGKRIAHLSEIKVRDDALAATLDAMRAGVEVIAQGALGAGHWYGRPDILLRVDSPSTLGTWSYEVADTKLYVEERGEPSAFPLLVFHGGPGLDYTMFGDYLDRLTEGGSYRLVLVDERACGRSDRTAPRETWTLERMAQDVNDLAASLGVSDGYATLGHSYGAFVVLQHAVDYTGEPRGTIVSAGMAAARLSGPLATAWFSWLMWRRIRLEDRALRYPTCS